MRRPDAVLEPVAWEKVVKYIKAQGRPESIIEELSDNYYGGYWWCRPVLSCYAEAPTHGRMISCNDTLGPLANTGFGQMAMLMCKWNQLLDDVPDASHDEFSYLKVGEACWSLPGDVRNSKQAARPIRKGVSHGGGPAGIRQGQVRPRQVPGGLQQRPEAAAVAGRPAVKPTRPPGHLRAVQRPPQQHAPQLCYPEDHEAGGRLQLALD